ncbi:MAG: biopolymer transporter ExbD [Deltaproteobacteria bacterium]|nr:biopolymer transporter ExbD [Deltaproteobacteria bacterium]MBW2384926.1 biopolymer transporter ExbD [Deltaproteobacteria bacterium]MBW2698816.1 biopolymer transporter ExbD [Deltaproteobacteria bacterium]
MAISTLPGSGEHHEADEIVAEINVTPLTDIFLVLLIIFMVTTTAVQQEGKNIDLPSADIAEKTTPKGVTVEIDKVGRLKVNDTITAEADLAEALRRAVQAAEDKVVVLRGDKRVPLGQAVQILDLAQKAGAEGIAISTQQPAL